MADAAFDANLAAWRANINGRMARWARSHRELRCKFATIESPHRIAPGEAYRRVTTQDWPMCKACAKARYDEDPPESLAPLAPIPMPLQHTDDFGRFDRRRTGSTVRQHILDARQRQSGEREAGEEG